MMRMTSSLCSSSKAWTTKRIEPGPTAPSVIQRSSSSKAGSRCVRAKGSSKTRTAVSKRTACLRRFWRFLSWSHSNRMAGVQRQQYKRRDSRSQYNCTYVAASRGATAFMPCQQAMTRADRRELAAGKDGGEGGIRTHGTVPRTLAFEASTFNHSVTSPQWSVRTF